MTVTGVDVYTTDMTVEEAKECVRLIHTHLGNLRALLLELYQRKGWRVLGYETWRACAVQEFAYDETYLYRLLSAAIVEQNVFSPIGENRESHLRPITALEPDEQRIVWTVVKETAPNGKVTTGHVNSVVAVFKEVMVTGAVDNGDGESVSVHDLVKLAVAEETKERLHRYNEHISTALQNASQTRYKASGTVLALQHGDLHITLKTGVLRDLEAFIGKEVVITIREATDG